MDGPQFDSFTRALTVSRSRRALTLALAGLVGELAIAPLLHDNDADAGGKKGKRRRKKRKKNKPKARRCGRKAAWCEAGEFSACCSTVIEPDEDDFQEICTHDCGCCDRGFSKCCAGTDQVICCKNTDTCVTGTGPSFVPFCCPADQEACNGACCQVGTKCCRGSSITECCPIGACCPTGHCAPPLLCPLV